MNDKQRLREIEEVLTMILQEQEKLKAEMLLLQVERTRAEERIAQLERLVENQQRGSDLLLSFEAATTAHLLEAERLWLHLMQPQTQN